MKGIVGGAPTSTELKSILQEKDILLSVYFCCSYSLSAIWDMEAAPNIYQNVQ